MPTEMETLFLNSPSEQERIGRNVGNFSVGLFGVNGSADYRDVRLVGSGTLVSLDREHYVLTAAHVWGGALDEFQSTGLTLKEDVDHCFPIPNAAIDVRELPGTKFDEWGPDVALLRIPEEVVGSIEAYRVFYNLRKERKAIGNGHWGARILVGTPGVLAKGIGRVQVVEMQGMYLQVDAAFYDHDKVDLIDFEMDTTLPQVINDFRGVSGGGLWNVEIFPTGDGKKFDSTEALVGVAFHQLGLKHSIQTVRCHGPKTIQALIESARG
ncbi:MAG: hypothetical protein WBE86_00770 [Candidatus Acidiferrales bacterium]